MRLDWIAVSGFRSHAVLEWRPDPGVNVLVGENGAGKTNLLEAVSYLATLKSFRGAPDDALVAFESESAVVRGAVEHAGSTSLIEIEIRRRGPRRVQVNRQRLARSADMGEHARIVSFLPEDLDLIKRGPAQRRDLIDDAAVQLWPGAYADGMEFDRALRQRNAFLKQGVQDDMTMAVWDERLAQAGGRLMVRRARTLDALAERLVTAYRRISTSDSTAELAYRSSWCSVVDGRRQAGEYAEEILIGLQTARRADRERRVTTVGPHRDDPEFVVDAHDARHHASQGEQRTLALAVRLATHRAVAETTDSMPILLFDDVYSELDPGRAAALTRALPSAQTLITTADPSHVPLEGAHWRIAGGAVSPG